MKYERQFGLRHSCLLCYKLLTIAEFYNPAVHPFIVRYSWGHGTKIVKYSLQCQKSWQLMGSGLPLNDLAVYNP